MRRDNLVRNEAQTASDDPEYAPIVRYIANAWPNLRPHIKEAILTLVDCDNKDDIFDQ